MSAEALTGGYRAALFSPMDATRAVIHRVQSCDPWLSTYVFLDEDGALAAAEASTKRWTRGTPASALDGVPFGIKDVFDVAHWPTLRGSFAIPDNHRAPTDCSIVAAMRSAGAIPIGKTATSEFAWGCTTDSPRHGRTRNPHAPTLTTGGSSGGAAAAAAAGFGTIQIGSDVGGSICCPAAWCGVVGYRPTVGELADEVIRTPDEVETAGILARHVGDVSVARAVLLRDGVARGATTSPVPHVLSIGYSPDLGFAHVDARIATTVLAAARVTAATFGAELVRVAAQLEDARRVLRAVYRERRWQRIAMMSTTERARLQRRWQRFWAEGPGVSLSTGERASLVSQILRSLERFDVILAPTCEIFPFAIGLEEPEHEGTDFELVAQCFCLAQAPCVTIPCGYVENLPVGLLLASRPGEDALLLAVAAKVAERLKSSRQFSLSSQYAAPFSS